jgi:hypothetical protein
MPAADLRSYRFSGGVDFTAYYAFGRAVNNHNCGE